MSGLRSRKDTDRARRTHILETAEGRTCQDTKRNRTREAYSRSGDGRGRDLSGHGKKQTKLGALTFWRWQRVGLVRTRKETHRAGCTHQLEMAEGGTCQDTKRNRLSKVHSRPGDNRWRDFVRTRKETDQAKCTHVLETADGGTCQDTEKN